MVAGKGFSEEPELRRVRMAGVVRVRCHKD